MDERPPHQSTGGCPRSTVKFDDTLRLVTSILVQSIKILRDEHRAIFPCALNRPACDEQRWVAPLPLEMKARGEFASTAGAPQDY